MEQELNKKEEQEAFTGMNTPETERKPPRRQRARQRKWMRYVRPLQEYESYSSSTNDETQKVMFRIMQIVMSWEPEEENH